MSERRREEFQTPSGGVATLQLDWSGHFVFQDVNATVERVFPHYYLGLEVYESQVQELLKVGGRGTHLKRSEVPSHLLKGWFSGGLCWLDGRIMGAVAALGEDAVPEEVDDLIEDDVKFMEIGWLHATRALLTHPKAEILSLDLSGANASSLRAFASKAAQWEKLVELSLPRLKSNPPELNLLAAQLRTLALSSRDLDVLTGQTWPALRELRIDFQEDQVRSLHDVAEVAPSLEQVTLSCNFNGHIALESFARTELPSVLRTVFLDDPGGKAGDLEAVLQEYEPFLRPIPRLVLNASFAHRLESPPGTFESIRSWDNLVWA